MTLKKIHKVKLSILLTMHFFMLLMMLMGCGSELSCEGNPNSTYYHAALAQSKYPLIGSGQGIQYYDDKIYLYGDGETGTVQELDLDLAPTGWIGKFTYHGEDLVAHPTGLALKAGYPTIVGLSGVYYVIDWAVFRAEGNLDNALLNTVRDVQTRKASRPEYVFLGGEWLIATADYGGDGVGEIRLFDPEKLATAQHVDDPNVTLYRFPASPFVQSLHWMSSLNQLVLAQNTQPASGWKLTRIDLEKALVEDSGLNGAILSTTCFPYETELEGYLVLPSGKELFLTAESLFSGQ